MSLKEIKIEIGYGCDWKQKCIDLEGFVQNQKNPTLLFTKECRDKIGMVPKDILDNYFFYYFRFLQLLRKISSYYAIVERDIQGFEISIVLEANAVLCENPYHKIALLDYQSRAIKAVRQHMTVFGSVTKGVLSDLSLSGSFELNELLTKYPRLKKTFVYKKSLFDKKLKSNSYEIFSLESVDAKKMESLDEFSFFDSQNIEFMDVKSTFNHIYKSYKSNLNQYFSLCSYFLSALSVSDISLNKRISQKVRYTDRKMLALVLDGDFKKLDLAVFVLRFNYSVALVHKDETLKLDALKKLKKKLSTVFRAKKLESVWESQVFWSSEVLDFLPKIESIYPGFYELSAESRKTKFAYHESMYNDFIEISDPDTILSSCKTAFCNEYFSRKQIPVVAYFKHVALHFVFSYALKHKISFPKLIETLKSNQVSAFDTIDKCRSVFHSCLYFNGEENQPFKKWSEFEAKNKSEMLHNYVVNRVDFIQSLIFYLFGLGKELMNDGDFSSDEIYMYVRAATMTKNSFLEQYFSVFFNSSQASKMDFSFSQSIAMIRNVYDRV